MSLYNTYHTGLGGGFHGDLSVGVDLEAGIEDTIGDLIAELVWMSLTDGLGGEVKMTLFVIVHNIFFVLVV